MALPTILEDEDLFKKSQSQLFETGTGLVQGTPSELIKPLTEIGGESFEDMLNLTKRDVSKSVSEDIIRRNVGRGGLGASITAQRIGDLSVAARETERLRAFGARERLLTTGLSTLESVRGSEQRQSEFDQSLVLAREKFETQKFQSDREQKAAKQEALKNIISSTIGIAGNIFALNKLKEVFGATEVTEAVAANEALGAGTEGVKTAAEVAALAAAAPSAASLVGAGAGAAVGAGAGAGTVVGGGAGFGAGTATTSGMSGFAAGAGVLAIAAVIFKAFSDTKKKPVFVSPAQIVEKAGDFVKKTPNTVRSMVKMRELGVWDQEKNFIEHIDNVKFVEQSLQAKGQALTPEWDAYMSGVMEQGLSWGEEKVEFARELERKGILTREETAHEEFRLTPATPFNPTLPAHIRERQQAAKTKESKAFLAKEAARHIKEQPGLRNIGLSSR